MQKSSFDYESLYFYQDIFLKTVVINQTDISGPMFGPTYFSNKQDFDMFRDIFNLQYNEQNLCVFPGKTEPNYSIKTIFGIRDFTYEEFLLYLNSIVSVDNTNPQLHIVYYLKTDVENPHIHIIMGFAIISLNTTLRIATINYLCANIGYKPIPRIGYYLLNYIYDFYSDSSKFTTFMPKFLLQLAPDYMGGPELLKYYLDWKMPDFPVFDKLPITSSSSSSKEDNEKKQKEHDFETFWRNDGNLLYNLHNATIDVVSQIAHDEHTAKMQSIKDLFKGGKKSKKKRQGKKSNKKIHKKYKIYK